MFLRIALASSAIMISSLVLASDEAVAASDDGHPWEHYQYVMAGPIFGQPILGSDDTRRGQVYYYGTAFLSRQLSTSHVPAHFVSELYFNNTLGGGYNNIPKDTLHTWGVTAVMRFNPTWIGHEKLFIDLGWGMSYGNHSTYDLDANWNSTPIFGVGTTWDSGHLHFIAMARYMHFSNAGTRLPNRGENQLQYLIGIQF